MGDLIPRTLRNNMLYGYIGSVHSARTLMKWRMKALSLLVELTCPFKLTFLPLQYNLFFQCSSTYFCESIFIELTLISVLCSEWNVEWAWQWTRTPRLQISTTVHTKSHVWWCERSENESSMKLSIHRILQIRQICYSTYKCLTCTLIIQAIRL